ncbi:protein kinase [Thermodesulfobacteriota bacterium]
MTENGNTGKSEALKMGFTNWLKKKFLGKGKNFSPVDTQFLEDLVDVETVGRYEIIRKLGQGSMGVVYLGRDPYIKRDVGIKVSRPAANVVGREANKYREKFFLEAQSAGRLMHPNIVGIYDAGMYKDFCYIAMEYIDGPILEKFCCKDNLLPVSKAAEIIITACKALDYAHQRGIVHRDIKPSNIMINQSGEVRITDFGIAQMKTEHTISKGIIGSPSYMSPEQVKEEPIENVSDVFSVGCVMYELLTGRQAFPGDNYFSIMYKITNEDPAPIREIRPEIPDILNKITMRALAKDLNQRYQTCMDLAYDLRVALRGLKDGIAKKNNVEDVIDYVHNVQFFSNFTREQVQEILSAANVIKVSKGTVMVTEGEIDDSFYIILSGNAGVRKNNRDLATIGRGECFGEMAYLSGEFRTATVIAETDCILLKISAMLLDKSSHNIQLLFLKRFAMTLLRRLSVSISSFD